MTNPKITPEEAQKIVDDAKAEGAKRSRKIADDLMSKVPDSSAALFFVIKGHSTPLGCWDVKGMGDGPNDMKEPELILEQFGYMLGAIESVKQNLIEASMATIKYMVVKTMRHENDVEKALEVLRKKLPKNVQLEGLDLSAMKKFASNRREGQKNGGASA